MHTCDSFAPAAHHDNVCRLHTQVCTELDDAICLNCVSIRLCVYLFGEQDTRLAGA